MKPSMKYGKSTKNKRNMNMAIAGVVVVVIVVIAAVFLLLDRGDEAKARENVRDIYNLLTERDVEILASNYENGIYKIVVKTADIEGNSNTQLLFVTKDGKFMTDRMLDLEAYKTGLTKEKNFIQCLFDKGVRIVGITNNTASVLQVQALGNFGYKLYFDCSGPNLKICQDIGVVSVPSVIYNNTIHEGLKEAQWFITTTGCEF